MENVTLLNEVLSGYKVKADCVGYDRSNHFNIFQLKLKPGCKLRSLENLVDEIQLGMKLQGKPLFLMSPNDGTVKMISADEADKIDSIDLIGDRSFENLEAVIGIDAEGKELVVDLVKMPHLIVAGATGSGKSVFLHTLIANYLSLNRDTAIKLYLFDPKFVEFDVYKKYKGPRFITVRNKYKDIKYYFKLLHSIMEKRLLVLSSIGCKSISAYNKKYPDNKMPRIVCIVDELADLMSQDDKEKDFEKLVCTIAAKSRAAGIHLVLATQRPSTDVITGLIKANFPTRISFRVSSNVDSRVVLDYKGAENLMPKGDGILSGYGSRPVRFQAAFTNPIF